MCREKDENWSFKTQLNRAERFGHWRGNETLAAEAGRCQQTSSGCWQQILENAIQRLHGCQSDYNYYMAVDSYNSVCRQTKLNLLTGDQQRVGVGSVCRQALGAIDNCVLVVFELVYEFISDPISEILVSFSSWVLCLYIEGCCTLFCNLERWFVLRVLGLVCLRDFYSKLHSFCI